MKEEKILRVTLILTLALYQLEETCFPKIKETFLDGIKALRWM